MFGASFDTPKFDQLLLVGIGLLGAIFSGYLFVQALSTSDSGTISGSGIYTVIFYMLSLALFIRYRAWRRKQREE